MQRYRRFLAALALPFVVVWSVLLPSRAFAVPPLAAAWVVETGAPIAAELFLASEAGAAVASLPAVITEAGIVGTATWARVVAGVTAVVSAVSIGSGTVGAYRADVQISDPNRIPQGKTYPNDFTDDRDSALEKCRVAVKGMYGDDPTVPPCTVWLRQPVDSGLFPTLFACSVNCISATPGSGGAFVVTISEKPDGIRRFIRLSEGFVPDYRDPDWSSDIRDRARAGLVSPGAVEVRGFDSSTNTPVRTRIESGSGPNVRVSQETDFNVSGKVQTNLNTLEITPTGQVTNYQVVNNYFNNSSQTNSGSSFPDDYSRESTNQRIANALEAMNNANNREMVDKLEFIRANTAFSSVNTLRAADTLDSIRSELKNPGVAPADPSAPSESELKTPFSGLVDLLNPLRGFTVVGGGQCPSPSVQLFDQVYTFDVHCLILDQYGSALTASASVVWAIAGIVIVLRA